MNPVVPSNPLLPDAPADSALAPVSFDDTRVAFAHKTTRRCTRRGCSSPRSITPGWSGGERPHRLPAQARGPLVAWLVKRTVFEQFCGGESIQDCEPAVEALGRFGVESSSTTAWRARSRRRASKPPRARPSPPSSGRRGPPAQPVRRLQGHRGGALRPPGEAGRGRAARARRAGRVGPGATSGCCGFCERTARPGRADLHRRARRAGSRTVIDGLAEEMMARFNRERAVVYNTYQLYRTASLGNLTRGGRAGAGEGLLPGREAGARRVHGEGAQAGEGAGLRGSHPAGQGGHGRGLRPRGVLLPGSPGAGRVLRRHATTRRAACSWPTSWRSAASREATRGSTSASSTG